MANTTKKTTTKKTTNAATSKSMASQIDKEAGKEKQTQSNTIQAESTTEATPEPATKPATEPKTDTAKSSKDTQKWPNNIYERYGVGEKNITFQMTGSRVQNYFLKPKATLRYNNRMYRLRYSKSLDTPFVDLQPENLEGGDIELNYIRWENGLITAKRDDICLQKYLLVHPYSEVVGGSKFKVLEQEVEDKNYLDLDERRDDLKRDIKAASEEKIRASYAALFSPAKAQREDVNTLIKDIIMLLNNNPTEVDRVEDTIHDSKTFIKYKYHKLKQLGYIEMKYNKIMWSDSKGVIVKVPKGETPSEVFARELSKTSNMELLEEVNRLLK